jgi:hypothetical protein
VLSFAHGETGHWSAYIDAKPIHNARRVWEVGLLAKKITMARAIATRQAQGTNFGNRSSARPFIFRPSRFADGRMSGQNSCGPTATPKQDACRLASVRKKFFGAHVQDDEISITRHTLTQMRPV